MAVIPYNDAFFRTQFQAFSDPVTYSESTIQLYWDNATSFVSDETAGYCTGKLKLAAQTLALNYMTAHLMFLTSTTKPGQNTGLVASATIDKVSVSYVPPPEKDQWSYWLNQSPYGQALLALLSAHSAGGFYFGGRPETSAIRRVGGRLF